MKSNQLNNVLLEKDHFYIKQCFELAQKGAGTVSPNPLVGCVIVKNEKIIASGWHEYFGGPHAEAIAFSQTSESLENATLYCNLEPCCHTNKKTPPCLPLVLNSGIKRVVLSNRDPNPEVSGKSIQHMLDAGIEVIENVLADEGIELNRFFFKHVSSAMPWITIKIAQTMDAKIATDIKNRTLITGTEANTFVHKLRSDYDAVLIGSGTVTADNPQLDVRLVKGQNPLRIIVSGISKLDPNAKVFQNKDLKTWVFFPDKIENENKQILVPTHARLIEADSEKSSLVNLNHVIEFLGKQNINSVLVEGGQRIFTQFMSQNLFDEIIVMQSAQYFGRGISAVQFLERIDLKMHECKMFGNDCYINLRKKV